MAKPVVENRPEEKRSSHAKVKRDEYEQQQQEEKQEHWDQIYDLGSTESFSSDDFSLSSEEDGYSYDGDARYLNVEIVNEGANNKDKIQFFPKSNMRKINSSALLNQHTANVVASQADHISRVESAPILLPSSLPGFLADRIRNAERAGGDMNNNDKKPISHQPTAAQPIEGPATAALTIEDPRVVYSQILEKHGICSRLRKGEELSDFFVEMTEANVTGYTMDKVTAMRTEDIESLRGMHSKGETLQVCNRFGESIIHSACRRGVQSVVRFLVQEANVCLAVKDDYGKTPAHDACWTIKPNFEVVQIVLRSCPDLFLITDKRGSSPLDYTQKSLWRNWCAFLKENEELLIPKRLRQDLKGVEGEK